MPTLDFKEIPRANEACGDQDMFELFARDVLECVGFNILSGPDRGQDGGRDLIVAEERSGPLGTSTVRWLVSCKHKCHSGTAVGDSDEQNIVDRLAAHQASGFIGVYSTIVSSPFSRRLEALNKDIEVQIFDHERLETLLLRSSEGRSICKRYFPMSYSKWEAARFLPANILSRYEPLTCQRCDRDLLSKAVIEDAAGVVVFVEDKKFAEENNYRKRKYVDLYVACKGECDKQLDDHCYSNGYYTKWEDISDIVIPTKYLMWIIAILNQFYDERIVFGDECFKKLKEFIIAISQVVLREQSEEQLERISTLMDLPDYM